MLGRRDPEWTPAQHRMPRVPVEDGPPPNIIVKLGMPATLTAEIWGKLPAEEQVMWSYDEASRLYFDTRYECPGQVTSSAKPAVGE